MYMERTNFHEDSLRHFNIKADNARADGHQVGYAGYKPAKRSSLKGLLESDNLSPQMRSRIEKLVGPDKKKKSKNKKKDDAAMKMLSKLSPSKREKIMAMLAA